MACDGDPSDPQRHPDEIISQQLSAAAAAEAEQALEVAAQAASAAADARAAEGLPTPTVQRECSYTGWPIVAEAEVVQPLVRLFCPAVDTLLALNYDTAPEFADLPAPADPDAVWDNTPPEPLHDAMLLTVGGMKRALSWQGPEPLRKQLTKAFRRRGSRAHSTPIVRTWFWRALSVFQEEWGVEACKEPDAGAVDVGVVLRECVQNRVRCAQLLIRAYNLLLRGKPLPGQQQAIGQQQQQPQQQRQRRRQSQQQQQAPAAAAGQPRPRQEQQRQYWQQQPSWHDAGPPPFAGPLQPPPDPWQHPAYPFEGQQPPFERPPLHWEPLPFGQPPYGQPPYEPPPFEQPPPFRQPPFAQPPFEPPPYGQPPLYQWQQPPYHMQEPPHQW